MSAALVCFERMVAAALRSDDPVAGFAAIALCDELPIELRQAAAAADARGIRMSALLVAKLRFERLQQGSAVAGRMFAEDPRGFTDAFRRYHRGVPPLAIGPRAEGLAFERWLADPANRAV